MLALDQAVAPYGLACTSLRVNAGEQVALCGPNGAGKSTLIRLFAGTLKPQSGSVKLGDRDDWSTRDRARQVAVVAQADTLASDFTVGDTVATGRHAHRALFGPLSMEDRDAVDQALERADLTSLRDRRVGTLSGGERQRVALARALAQRAPVLLLDEPTAHLDIGRAARFLGRIKALDLTVVCAIHDLNLAAQFAPRVVLLDAGRVVADGAPKDVLSADRVAELFGVQVHATTHRGAPQFLPELAH